MAKIIGNSELLDTWSSLGAAIKPDSAKIELGWELSEKPPHEVMNWLQKNFGEKINHLLQKGVPSWSNETPYEAGCFVGYNNELWICVANHTNEIPSVGATNWRLYYAVFVETNPPTKTDFGSAGHQWFVTQNNQTELWSVTHHSPGQIFSLATDGKNVFSASVDGRLIASDFETGAVSWNTAGANLNPIFYDGGIIYGGSNSVTNVKTYDAETGGLIWNEALASDGSGVRQLLVTEDKIFCATPNGRLFSLEKTDGSTNWFVDFFDTFTNIILVGGVLYLPNTGGNIIRRNASNGASAGPNLETGNSNSVTGSTYENGLFFLFQKGSNQFSILSKTGSVLETKTISTGLYANGRVSNGFFLLNSTTLDGFSILSKTGVHLSFYNSVNAIPLLYYQGSVFSVTSANLKRFQGLPKHYVSDGNSWKAVSIMEGV